MKNRRVNRKTLKLIKQKLANHRNDLKITNSAKNLSSIFYYFDDKL